MTTPPSLALESPEVLNALLEFGFSEAEIAVYQALLCLGARPASILSSRAGLKRGHTYNVLKSLMQKGIVQESVKDSVRHFSASPPSSLISMLELRTEELTRQKAQLRRVVPELERLRNPLRRDPTVRFFRGIEGIKELYEDMLRFPEQDIRSLLDAQYCWTTRSAASKDWLQAYSRRRVARNIWWKAIVNRSAASDYAVGTRSELKREIKMIQGFDLQVELSIYAHKVALITADEEYSGILIENDAIASLLRQVHVAGSALLPDYPLPAGSTTEMHHTSPQTRDASYAPDEVEQQRTQAIPSAHSQEAT